MNDKKSILFVLELFWPHIGGVETLFQNLCRGLVERGYAITVITTKLRGYRAYEEHHGIKIYRVACGNRYGFGLLGFSKILSLAKTADILHTTTFNAALPAWLVARILKKPCCITVHEVWENIWGQIPGFNLPYRLFEKLVFSLKFDTYLAVSRFTKAQLVALGHIEERRVKVVYPGIDYTLFDASRYEKYRSRRYLQLPRDDFLYLYFGRPGWAKGLEYLLTAVPQIVGETPRTRLILILAPTPEENYKRMITLIGKLAIEQHLSLIEPVNSQRLCHYIAAADCVVAPSLSEGFGFMAAETCALGVPMVVTTAGSLPEVVSGRIVFTEAKNAAALARGVIRAWQGEFEHIPLKRFNLEATLQSHEEIYNSF